jgi:small redox-active disulfide protein 2
MAAHAQNAVQKSAAHIKFTQLKEFVMIIIKVLGSGCANCKRLEAVVRQVVEAEKIEAEIIKVTNFEEITKYPILHTPGLAINEKVVSSGRIPAINEVAGWLKTA